MAELGTTAACGLSSCALVCPANITDFQSEFNCEESAQNEGVVTLKFLTGAFGTWIESTAKRFSAERKDVNVEIVPISMWELPPNIVNEATSKTGLFDGFITPPGVMGSIVEEDGWADLKPFIEETIANTKDWSDILLSYRKWISQYQDRILMYPLDGDVLSLFYRKDVLEAFGLGVPRTWDEYNAVAAAVHGKVFKNQTLSGSCVGRVKGCAGAYWANLVLSSMTQTSGTSSGHLFDSGDMKPLLGEALLQALEWMEGHATGDEFDDCVAINDRLNDGSCAMTYNWGNTFAVFLNEGSVFNEAGYELGVARTPGSTRVLDRTTMKLVPCDSDRCRFGTYYDDIGWVNDAPYLAFGGWSCAVNNYTTPGKKRLAMEFCHYAASRDESFKQVVSNATTRIAGADPFRTSHLDVGRWVDDGYQQDSVESYFASIRKALESDNCVTDIRFPTSSSIYAVLDTEFHDYLNGTAVGEIPEAARPQVRKDICDRLERQWKEMITEYDSQTTSRSTALLQYQKLRGVYSVDYNYNQLGTGIITYGYALATLTLVSAVACGFWTYRNRTSSVVRASQPFFLILISVGVFVFGSSIIPMTIDDGNHSVEACDKACMAVPWLASMGWSILFAALYAKIRRVNLVIRNVMNFKSVKVSERDVMTPFAILFTANLVLLLVWTFVDPLYWERRQINATESYGTCAADTDSVGWKIILALLGTLNGAALVGANIEAWKARRIDTEYGESSYIGLIMASMLQVVLVGLPLSFLVQENPTARFFVNSSMAFVVCSSVLLLLFVPKVVNTLSNPDSKKSASKAVSEEEMSRSNRSNLALDDIKRKISTLEHLLQEAGINAARYIRESGLDRLDLTHTIGPAANEAFSQDCSVDRDSSRVREPSLPPVAEEEDDESNDMIVIGDTFPQEQATSPMNTRSSISRWLEKKKRTEINSGETPNSDSPDSENPISEVLPFRVDMAGSIASSLRSHNSKT